MKSSSGLTVFGMLMVACAPGDYHDLPDCGSYEQPPLWFELEGDFYDRVMEFDRTFDIEDDDEWPNAACLAVVEANDFEVRCDGWTLRGAWKRTERTLPLEDGQSVIVSAAGLDGDLGLGFLWIMDADRQLILGQQDSAGRSLGVMSNRLDLEPEPRCYYHDKNTWPIDPPSAASWLQGLAMNGAINDSPFSVPDPQTPGLTADGLYEVYIPIHYVLEYDTASASGQRMGGFLLQFSRLKNP